MREGIGNQEKFGVLYYSWAVMKEFNICAKLINLFGMVSRRQHVVNDC